MADTAPLVDFGEHPWAFREALDAGLYRAYGLRAVDGDTVDLLVDAGLRLRPQIRVRLAGIDTPEMYGVPKESDEYKAGKAAQERVAELIEGRPLLLYSGKDKGKYGRWISTVYVQISEGNAGFELSSILEEEGHGA